MLGRRGIVRLVRRRRSRAARRPIIAGATGHSARTGPVPEMLRGHAEVPLELPIEIRFASIADAHRHTLDLVSSAHEISGMRDPAVGQVGADRYTHPLSKQLSDVVG